MKQWRDLARVWVFLSIVAGFIVILGWGVFQAFAGTTQLTKGSVGQTQQLCQDALLRRQQAEKALADYSVQYQARAAATKQRDTAQLDVDKYCK